MNNSVNHGTNNERPDSFAKDLALLFEAIADAFRGLSPSTRLESRWSRLRECGRSFGPSC